MKEVFFNSQTNCIANSCDISGIIQKYVKVIKYANKLGYGKVRYEMKLAEMPLTKEESLQSYCCKHSRDTGCILLLSTACHPYIPDDENDKLEKYVFGSFSLCAEKQYDDLCFCAAYLSNSFCIGFDVKSIWKQLKYTISGYVVDDNIDDVLYCVVSVGQFEDRDFSKWLDEHNPIDIANIQVSSLKPEQKQIHLRDDHGLDVLKAHAKRLLKSPYVEKIINSTDFKPHCKRYIDKVNCNGQIEIVLLKTEQKCGMVVQTTARNIKEAACIAEELKKKFAE